MIRKTASGGSDPDFLRGVSKARWIDDQRILYSSRDGRLEVIDLAKKTSRVVATDVPGAAISQTARSFLTRTTKTGYDVWQATVVE